MKIINFLPAGIALLLSTILLVLPGSNFSGNFLHIPHFDKFVHIGLFCVLNFFGMLPFLLYRYQWRSVLLLSTLTVVVYGLVMEFVQLYFVRGRSFEMMDWLADIAGALTAYFFTQTKWCKTAVQKIGPDRNRDRNQN